MTGRDSIMGPAGALEPAALGRILVRTTNWVGDLILMTPALTALRRAFPAATITALATPPVFDLLVANPDLDDVMLYDRAHRHRGWSGRLALIREVRGRRFDLGVVFPHAFEGALLFRLAGIPIRVGYRAEGRGWLLTHPVRPVRARRHQLYHYVALLEAVGVKPDHHGPVLRLPAEAFAEADRLLGQEGIGPGSRPGIRLVGLNPGAAYGPAKRWPAERYAALARLVVERLGATPIVMGAPSDQESAREVLRAFEADDGGRLISLAGRTTLSGAAAVIARCRALVTNDSGLMHVGAALGVPVVAVFGPTDPAQTGPLGNGHAILRKMVACSPCRFRVCPIDHRCMEWITVQDVYDEVAGRLREGG